VKKFLDNRLVKNVNRRTMKQYLIEWRDDTLKNTWVDEDDLNCPHLFKAYLRGKVNKNILFNQSVILRRLLSKFLIRLLLLYKFRRTP